jgi:hypothetical protein
MQQRREKNGVETEEWRITTKRSRSLGGIREEEKKKKKTKRKKHRFRFSRPINQRRGRKIYINVYLGQYDDESWVAQGFGNRQPLYSLILTNRRRTGVWGRS